MLNTVLEQESYLFSSTELAAFERYRALSCPSSSPSCRHIEGGVLRCATTIDPSFLVSLGLKTTPDICSPG